MKDIKTKQTVHDIKVLDKSADIGHRMKNAYVRLKEQAEQIQRAEYDSPGEYAENKAQDSAVELSHNAGRSIRRHGQRLAATMRNLIKNRKESGTGAPFSDTPASENRPSTYNTQSRKAAKDRMKTSVHNQAEEGTKLAPGSAYGSIPRSAENNISRSAEVAGKTIKQHARGSIKAAERSIKTAEQSSKVAVKTSRTAAETARKTTQATVKASQKAAQATRAASKAAIVTAKNVAKATVATVKAVITAVKGLITAIAAGGWIAIAVIVVIAVVGVVFCSPLGIFASEQGYEDNPSMPDVVAQINSEFSEKIDDIIADTPHDTLIINNEGTASMVANWSEVLAVYAIKTTSDPDNPVEVATLNQAKTDMLRTVFWDMNSIAYDTDTVEHEETTTEIINGEGVETSITTYETILTISVNYKAYTDMIVEYGFGAQQVEQLGELMKPEYQELFMRLTGSYVDITLSAAEIAAIMETLPDDLSKARKDVVLTAYSLLDKVNYFWGGKSLVRGWDSRWGTPMKVTADDSPTTGTVHPFGLDCSGLVDWVFYNALDRYVLGHGGGAASQYGYCDAIAWSSAQPGDLVFYTDCEHVGIVVQNDRGTLTVIHCASGYNNVVMTQHTQGNGFAFVGRPQIYND